MRHTSFFRFFLISAVILASSSCQTLKLLKQSQINESLSQKNAQDRAERIADIHYELSVKIDENSSNFTGTQKVRFELRNTQSDLWIDFAGQVTSLSINGSQIGVAEKYGVFLVLPQTKLHIGSNTLEINFISSYRNDGVGIHRFQDPKDQNIYLYSQFEPFDANKFAPFFDQPDLKATLKLTVQAPKKWQVITATQEEKTEVSGGDIIWEFKPTPKISTYLYSLIAGPYKMWKSNYKNIPLRIFARQSMAPYVRTREWFRVTQQGLAFFQNYFSYPYPFEKYDQIMVPEFNAGAMENVAAVTFSEAYLRRGSISLTERQGFASTILHEMAHMWFGDLVTMKWWNDLWLNESFATFMSALALAEIPEFQKQVWIEFFEEKIWAYKTDLWPTTHPIEAQVINTNEAFTNFDGITYGKGAAVLKQILFHVSPEAFKTGVRDYIKKYAWRNADLKDFILSLEVASGQNLQEWKSAWLQTTGVENYEINFTCDAQNKFDQLTISAIDTKKVRPQSFRLGFLFKQNSKLVEIASLKVSIKNQKTLVTKDELNGLDCPNYVFINSNDHAYAIQIWSKLQADKLLNDVGSISDEGLRYQIWHSLWLSLREGQISAQKYVSSTLNALANETSARITKFIMRTLLGSNTSYGALDFMKNSENQKILRLKTEIQLWNQFLAAKNNKDKQVVLFSAALNAAQSKIILDRMENVFTGKNRVPNFQIDQDRRWVLLTHLCRLNHPNCGAWVNSELKIDTTDLGQNAALTALAMQPDQTNKQNNLINILKDKNNLSLDETESILEGLFPKEQSELKLKFNKDILEFIENDLVNKSESFQTVLSEYLSPLSCELDPNKVFKKLVINPSQDGRPGKGLSKISKKSFSESLYEDDLCLKLRDISDTDL